MALDGTYRLDVTADEWAEAQKHGLVAVTPDSAPGVYNRADVYVDGAPTATFGFNAKVMRPGERIHLEIRPPQNDEEAAIRRWLFGGL